MDADGRGHSYGGENASQGKAGERGQFLNKTRHCPDKFPAQISCYFLLIWALYISSFLSKRYNDKFQDASPLPIQGVC